MLGLPGLAAVAQRIRVLALRSRSGLGDEKVGMEVRFLPTTDHEDSQHYFPRHPYPTHRLICCRVVPDPTEERHTSPWIAAGTRTLLPPDRLGGASPVPNSDGASGP